MPKKEYRLRPEPPEEVKSELGEYQPLIQKILYHRGIDTKEKARIFLSPDYEGGLHDPYLMKGMDRAVERVLEAIEKKENIFIYSDYDADGIPGGVLMKEFFDIIGYDFVYNYIPHRHDEGFGLNEDAVESIKEKKGHLIITVDCGISDVGAVEKANNLGIDVIITDHHESANILPKALAILDPKQKDCNYPEKNLCGSAVAFKLVQAILQKNRFSLPLGKEKWLLDLVGIATLSDMVPLVGENRIFAFYGLKVLQKSSRPGLEKLWRKLGVNQRFISEDDIGFTLAPRINAASRMGEPMDAFRLLYTKDPIEADTVSDHLNKINNERKGVVAAIVKEIKKHLRERKENGTLQNIVVIGDPSWKPALLGLAANSVVEEFNRPVFIWGRNGDSSLKGSCRSIPGFDLFSLMTQAKDSFLQFGGHKMAGGFSISSENVHSLEDSLNKVQIEDGVEEVNWIDAHISLDEIEETSFGLSKILPFGIGNEKPVFMFEKLEVKNIRQFGKEKNHLEIVFENSVGETVRAISFFSAPEKYSIDIKNVKTLNLIAHIEKSVFRNSAELRLRILDIV